MDLSASGGCRADDAGDHPEQRALSGPVFSDYSQAATAFYGNIDIFDRPKRLMLTPLSKRHQFLQVVRVMLIDPEALRNLVGFDDRHANIIPTDPLPRCASCR
jgi:hypothetical protein